MDKSYVCACQWLQSMPGHLTLHHPLHTRSRAQRLRSSTACATGWAFVTKLSQARPHSKWRSKALAVLQQH